MKPTDVLMNEHRLIERVLDALEAAANQVERGRAVPAAFFLDAAEFIAGFADGCHHRKEEGVLFDALAAGGMPTHAGPIGVMLMEHEQGRAFTRALRSAARRLESGDADAGREVARQARGYVALLREHITKEDDVLFPMADQLLGADQQRQVMAGFDKIEAQETGEGAHEKFHALAERLETEARALAS